MADEDVNAKLDALTAVVRKQGRAALAAQAAAEECLAKVSLLASEGGAEQTADPDRWARALLPVADALDRLVEAERGERERKRGLLERLSKPPSTAVGEGLRVLRAQFAEALAELGVDAIRPNGATLDATSHRVVETRVGPRDEVLEVVRPGYRREGILLREADVVVGKGEER